MSLLDGANFSTMDTLSSDYTFYKLFYNCTSLTDASKLLLPAITLTNDCYEYMFDGCTNITTAPELPAATLAVSCYYKMFNNCINLNYIKCLAIDKASYCTTNWVNGVASSGTFIGDPNSS
jgi:hypothetical protein